MEPIVSSETSAIRTQTTGNYPKRNKLHLEHGESLKTRNFNVFNNPSVFCICFIDVRLLLAEDNDKSRHVEVMTDCV